MSQQIDRKSNIQKTFLEKVVKLNTPFVISAALFAGEAYGQEPTTQALPRISVRERQSLKDFMFDQQLSAQQKAARDAFVSSAQNKIHSTGQYELTRLLNRARSERLSDPTMDRRELARRLESRMLAYDEYRGNAVPAAGRSLSDTASSALKLASKYSPRFKPHADLIGLTIDEGREALRNPAAEREALLSKRVDNRIALTNKQLADERLSNVQTWTEIYNLARQDPDFAAVVDPILQQYFGFSTMTSLQGLLDREISDPRLKSLLSKVIDNQEIQKEELREIDKSLSHLLEKQRSETKGGFGSSRQEYDQLINNNRQAAAVVDITSGILGTFGGPEVQKHAREFSTVAHSILAIDKAFIDAGAFPEQFGGAVLAGNVVGAALAIVNIFMGTKDINSIILEEVQALREDVGKMRQTLGEMRQENYEYYRALDGKLTDVLLTLDRSFARVENLLRKNTLTLNEIQNELGAVHSGLQELHESMEATEERLRNNIRDAAQRISNSFEIEVLGNPYRTSSALPYEIWNRGLTHFRSKALSDSLDSLSGEVREGSEYTLREAYRILRASAPTDNLEWLVKFIEGRHQLNVIPHGPHYQVPHASTWLAGTRKYLDLYSQSPEHHVRVKPGNLDPDYLQTFTRGHQKAEIKDPKRQDIEALAGGAVAIEDARKGLAYSIDRDGQIKPRIDIYNALIDDYRDNVIRVHRMTEDLIREVQQRHFNGASIDPDPYGDFPIRNTVELPQILTAVSLSKIVDGKGEKMEPNHSIDLQLTQAQIELLCPLLFENVHKLDAFLRGTSDTGRGLDVKWELTAEYKNVRKTEEPLEFLTYEDPGPKYEGEVKTHYACYVDHRTYGDVHLSIKAVATGIGTVCNFKYHCSNALLEKACKPYREDVPVTQKREWFEFDIKALRSNTAAGDANGFLPNGRTATIPWSAYEAKLKEGNAVKYETPVHAFKQEWATLIEIAKTIKTPRPFKGGFHVVPREGDKDWRVTDYHAYDDYEAVATACGDYKIKAYDQVSNELDYILGSDQDLSKYPFKLIDREAATRLRQAAEELGGSWLVLESSLQVAYPTLMDTAPGLTRTFKRNMSLPFPGNSFEQLQAFQRQEVRAPLQKRDAKMSDYREELLVPRRELHIRDMLAYSLARSMFDRPSDGMKEMLQGWLDYFSKDFPNMIEKDQTEVTRMLLELIEVNVDNGVTISTSLGH